MFLAHFRLQTPGSKDSLLLVMHEVCGALNKAAAETIKPVRKLTVHLWEQDFLTNVNF